MSYIYRYLTHFYEQELANNAVYKHGLLAVTVVIKIGKTVWKHEPYCWYFCLNLKYLWWPYRAYIKTAKNGGSREKLLSENDFEAVLASFCCYGYGANSSEAAPKIATYQKDYRKCSSCVVVCLIAIKYINQ